MYVHIINILLSKIYYFEYVLLFLWNILFIRWEGSNQILLRIDDCGSKINNSFLLYI